MTPIMRDQKDAPDSNAAKLAKARAYLSGRNIAATAPGNAFRYTPAADGSRVLRSHRRAM